MAGVEHAPRLDEQQLDFIFCIGFVLKAFGDDKHFTGRQVNRSIAKVDPQQTIQDQECLVGLLVIMLDVVSSFPSPIQPADPTAGRPPNE